MDDGPAAPRKIILIKEIRKPGKNETALGEGVGQREILGSYPDAITRWARRRPRPPQPTAVQTVPVVQRG